MPVYLTFNILPSVGGIRDICTDFDFQICKKCEKIPANKVLKWRKKFPPG